MSALEVTKTSRTMKNHSDLSLWMHCGIVLLLDILLIYFFQPPNPLFALVFAVILWKITWEDYTRQTIDIRWLFLLFVISLFCRGTYPWFFIFSGISGFFVLHIIHELFVIKEKTENNECGDFHFAPIRSGLDESTAPAYVPFFVVSMSVLLLYYLLALPMPHLLEFSVFETPVFADMKMPWFFWCIPSVLAVISVGVRYRARRLMKKGYNLVYRGFGDGDIYFFGAMIGIFGLIFTLVTIFISLFPAYFASKRWQQKGCSK